MQAQRLEERFCSQIRTVLSPLQEAKMSGIPSRLEVGFQERAPRGDRYQSCSVRRCVACGRGSSRRVDSEAAVEARVCGDWEGRVGGELVGED